MVTRDHRESIELSIVLPTMDVLSDRVRSCVHSIRSNTQVAYEVVLVENHSPPQGFSAPVNAAITASKGSYVVVMNDDVEVLAGWWPPLKEPLDHGAGVSFPKSAPYHRHDFSGWCFAFRRAALGQIGHSERELFDPGFKVWFQDGDLLLRLCEAGNPPVLAPDSRVRHGLSQTLTDDLGELKPWVSEQIEQDRARFSEKWPGGRRGELARRLLRENGVPLPDGRPVP